MPLWLKETILHILHKDGYEDPCEDKRISKRMDEYEGIKNTQKINIL